ncbi:MAG: sterol desaturase family protein [Candidatus Doudnabacteria bacterium]|nr:sterol desaturase family protein [Candidatus Doudnabacteria bacterium]
MSFFAGLLMANLGEYWVHRMQHQNMVKGSDHADHHRDNAARGVFKEYWAYLRPSLAVMIPITFLNYYSLNRGVAISWFLGALIGIAFSAWTHEVQHTNPNLVFWSKPLHFFHHNHTPNHNFGFSFSLWDRMFGTYKEVSWNRVATPRSEYWKVKW